MWYIQRSMLGADMPYVYKKQHTESQRNKIENKGDKATSLQRCRE